MPETSTTQPPPSSVRDRVAKVVEWLRPIIQSDGGDIELVEVTDAGVVTVRFQGACVGCPSSSATLRMGIEKSIREKVPEVTRVEALPD